MKIVGLLVARDEEQCIGLTIDTVKDLVDAIVFVDHSSKDRTKEIVKAKCEEHGIQLRTFTKPHSWILADLRMFAWQRAKALNPDWTFTIDGDMIYVQDTDKEALNSPPGLELCSVTDIRAIAEKGEFDLYFFPTLNFSMDIHHTAAMNMPHLYLIRYKPGIKSNANFYADARVFKQDFKRNRFIGWNLTYLRHYKRIFWRRHMPGQRLYNRENDCRISVDEFIRKKYGPSGPRTGYQQQYILDIFNRPTDLKKDKDKYGPRNWETQSKPQPYSKKLYGEVPECIRKRFGHYKMIFDGDQLIGRLPDIEIKGDQYAKNRRPQAD